MKAWTQLLLLAAALCALPAPAETLLVVRKTDDAVDFVDPGSGLRLASITLGHAPHEISVSPDGRRAVVSNYGTRERPGSTLSLLDLEQPRELGRIELGPHTRPHGVAWFAPDRIAVTMRPLSGSTTRRCFEPSVVTAMRSGANQATPCGRVWGASSMRPTSRGCSRSTRLSVEPGCSRVP